MFNEYFETVNDDSYLSPNKIQKEALGHSASQLWMIRPQMSFWRQVSMFVTHIDTMWDIVDREMPTLYSNFCTGGFNLNLISYKLLKVGEDMRM